FFVLSIFIVLSCFIVLSIFIVLSAGAAAGAGAGVIAGAAVSAAWFSSLVEQAASANTAATRAMRFIDDLLRRGGMTGGGSSGAPGPNGRMAGLGLGGKK